MSAAIASTFILYNSFFFSALCFSYAVDDGVHACLALAYGDGLDYDIEEQGRGLGVKTIPGEFYVGFDHVCLCLQNEMRNTKCHENHQDLLACFFSCLGSGYPEGVLFARLCTHQVIARRTIKTIKAELRN